MPNYIDQTGQILFIKENPQRIISLVPSQTELLADLGLNNEVVGITRFCVHPEEWFRTKTRVGGTKQLKLELIRKLDPDLIIANKEENLKDQVEELKLEFPVWVSDVNNLETAFEMIEQLGTITNRAKKAKEIIADTRSNFEILTPILQRYSAIYLIWQKPYMTVGGDTFINAMMEAAGLDNLVSGEQRYPELSLETIREMAPELLLLSSEPFPFREKHAEELQLLLPHTKVLLVDGEMFSWYGSRMKKASSYLKTLL